MIKSGVHSVPQVFLRVTGLIRGEVLVLRYQLWESGQWEADSCTKAQRAKGADRLGPCWGGGKAAGLAVQVQRMRGLGLLPRLHTLHRKLPIGSWSQANPQWGVITSTSYTHPEGACLSLCGHPALPHRMVGEGQWQGELVLPLPFLLISPNQWASFSFSEPELSAQFNWPVLMPKISVAWDKLFSCPSFL